MHLSEFWFLLFLSVEGTAFIYLFITKPLSRAKQKGDGRGHAQSSAASRRWDNGHKQGTIRGQSGTTAAVPEVEASR